MGRQLKLRPSYKADARFCSRMEEAYSMDPRLGDDDKRELVELWQQLALKLQLLNVPSDGG